MLRPSLFHGELVEKLDVRRGSARRAVSSKLDWTDLNLTIFVPLTEDVRRFLHMEIAPFIVRVGECIVEYSLEGIVVVWVDEW